MTLRTYVRNGDAIGYYITDENGDRQWRLLANFYAEIIERTHDLNDEVQVSTRYKVRMFFDSKPPLEFILTSENFDRMNWPSERGHIGAVIAPGPLSLRDEARTAILMLSQAAPTYLVVNRLGWYQGEDGRAIYVAGDGAVLLDAAQVEKQSQLSSGYAKLDAARFPILPISDPTKIRVHLADNYRTYGFKNAKPDALKSAFEVVETMVNLGPGCGLLMLASALTSVIGRGRFSVILIGNSGVFKSTMASAALAFFATGVSEKNLTASFSSTANALNQLLGFFRDLSPVFDDLNHDQNAYKAREAAENLVRANGNETNRIRMRGDTSLRDPLRPRAVPVLTAESFTAETSINTRSVRCEIRDKSAIDVKALTRLNGFRDNGTLCGIMAQYVRWLLGGFKFEAQRPRVSRRLRGAFDSQDIYEVDYSYSWPSCQLVNGLRFGSPFL